MSNFMRRCRTIALCLTTMLLVVDARTTGSKGKSRNSSSKFLSNVKNLKDFEFQIIKNLTHALLATNSLPEGTQIRQLVHLYLIDYYQTNGYSNAKDTFFEEETDNLSGLVCQYRLVRRIKFLLQGLVAKVPFRLKFGSLWRWIINFFWKNGWPSYNDLEITIDKILEIQNENAYDFGVEFADGWVSDVHTSCTLKSVHCYEIANFALKKGQTISAIEWLDLAKDKVYEDREASPAWIEFLLQATIEGVDDFVRYFPLQNVTALNAKANEQLPVENTGSNTEKLSRYSFLVPEGIKALAHLEWKIYARIKKLYAKYRSRKEVTPKEELDEATNKDVLMYLSDFEQSSGNIIGSLEFSHPEAVKIGEQIAWNLLAVYKMVARFRNYLQIWAQTRPNPNNMLMKRITFFLNKVYSISEGPLRYDFESALFSVVHTHYLYNLNVTDIAAGHVHGIDMKVKLNSRDLFEIGKASLQPKFFTTRIEWLEGSLYLVQNVSDDLVKYEEVQDELQKAKMIHECYYATHTSEACETYLQLLGEEWEDEEEETTDYRDAKYWAICKGKVYQAAAVSSKLFCWYEHEIHYTYKIGPVKAEIHSRHPQMEVVQYYDVITDEAIRSLTNFSPQKFEPPATKSEIFKRQAAYAWLKTMDMDAHVRISGLMERLRGLKTVNQAGGGIRFSAYTPGGHRARHLDGTPNHHIASLMLYLSDVGKGGETAFVQPGIKLAPKKGSAVFWYNLFSCGTVDELSDHGSCPVIFGEKWIALKIMAYPDQPHLKCHLKPKTAFEILVNGKSKYGS